MSYEKKIDGGGSAFPCPADNASGWHAEYGMSLRDWFAGQALGYLGQRKDVSIRDAAHIATISYELADAMLAARKAGEE